MKPVSGKSVFQEKGEEGNHTRFKSAVDENDRCVVWKKNSAESVMFVLRKTKIFEWSPGFSKLRVFKIPDINWNQLSRFP